MQLNATDISATLRFPDKIRSKNLIKAFYSSVNWVILIYFCYFSIFLFTLLNKNNHNICTMNAGPQLILLQEFYILLFLTFLLSLTLKFH